MILLGCESPNQPDLLVTLAASPAVADLSRPSLFPATFHAIWGGLFYPGCLPFFVCPECLFSETLPWNIVTVIAANPGQYSTEGRKLASFSRQPD